MECQRGESTFSHTVLKCECEMGVQRLNYGPTYCLDTQEMARIRNKYCQCIAENEVIYQYNPHNLNIAEVGSCKGGSCGYSVTPVHPKRRSHRRLQCKHYN